VTIFYVQFDEVSNTLLNRLLNLLDGVACHQAKKGLGHTTGVARTHGILEYWYLKFNSSWKALFIEDLVSAWLRHEPERKHNLKDEHNQALQRTTMSLLKKEETAGQQNAGTETTNKRARDYWHSFASSTPQQSGHNHALADAVQHVWDTTSPF